MFAQLGTDELGPKRSGECPHFPDFRGAQMDLGPPNYVKSPALQRECLHIRPLLTDARSPAHRCRRGELQPTSMGTDRAPIRPMRATADRRREAAMLIVKMTRSERSQPAAPSSAPTTLQ